MDFEELAKEICLKAHEGQLDKGGHPYYLHPFKVASYGKTTEERIVGYLHDTVEDTNITLKDLENYGFSKEIVLAVDAITHREDESYDEYLTRLSKNPLATKVKINDFINNRVEHGHIAPPRELSLEWAICNAQADALASYLIKTMDVSVYALS